MKKHIHFIGVTALTFTILYGFSACTGDYNTIQIEIEMAAIPAGRFLMGSPDSEVADSAYRERPQREVVLTKGFRMGKYLITQNQYQTVMGNNPSYHRKHILPAEVNENNLPVERVSWYDAVEFCNRLSELEERSMAYTIDKNTPDANQRDISDGWKWTVKLNTGTNGYRLPTEAQWEYACRAGTTTPFNTGETITTDQANFNGNTYGGTSPGKNLGRTSEVGAYPANAWGLYDMHGNVYEFCWDWVFEFTHTPVIGSPAYEYAIEHGFDGTEFIDYYNAAPNPDYDPLGQPYGERRAERGGTYQHDPISARSAYRERIRLYDKRRYDLGFRVVLPLDGETW